jgi:hypothetical protein
LTEALVKGTRPGHLPEPSRQTTTGRICAADGCSTRLSVYNDGRFCWQHTDLAFPNYRGKRLAPGKA